MKFLPKLIGSALLICCTSAQAWFFFFLPGSVTGKITDAITGAEGDHCVGAEAKVGSQIRLANGEIKIVKSISGTSSRCADAKHPIRAQLETVNLTSNIGSSNIGFDLPLGVGGWTQRTIPESHKSNGVIFLGSQPSTDAWLSVSSTPRIGKVDLMTLATDKLANFKNGMTNASESEIISSTINGIPVLRFNISGQLRTTKNNLTYAWTVFDLENEVLIITTWIPTVNWLFERQTLEKLPERISSSPNINSLKTADIANILIPDIKPLNVNPIQPSAVVTPNPLSIDTPTAKRLRDLTELFNQGLINEKEFLEKKKSILDSL
jgi:hypothetical protein